MDDATTSRSRARRGRVALAGLAVGALLGVAVAATSGGAAAERRSELGHTTLDATHVPLLLRFAGEAATLRYDVHCARAVEDPAADPSCAADGTVFVRAGMSGPFQPVPLVVESAAEGRYVARVPASIAAAKQGFAYYAVLRSADAALTLPPRGAEAPHRSLPIGQASDVALGRHEFGRARRADDRAAEAQWGTGADEVGLESGPNAAPVGGAAFDVDASGRVYVLDQVNRRVLRWDAGGWDAGAGVPHVVPVSVDGTIADLSVSGDGTMHVLEGGRTGSAPVLKTFDPSGRSLGVVAMPERTATQVRPGPAGPLVLVQPSGQWVPVARGGAALSATAVGSAPTSGRQLREGDDEVLVLRTGNELRAALARENTVRRAWRVTSATPLAEVQLVEPIPTGASAGLLVVVRVYTDAQDEFVALVLGSRGLLARVALDSSDWAESAPLSRFRLSGTSLYQLGSTRAGLFVDRFDLEVR
jgi:hypothetical protein